MKDSRMEYQTFGHCPCRRINTFAVRPRNSKGVAKGSPTVPKKQSVSADGCAFIGVPVPCLRNRRQTHP
jgi:hypothetical protein